LNGWAFTLGETTTIVPNAAISSQKAAPKLLDMILKVHLDTFIVQDATLT